MSDLPSEPTPEPELSEFEQSFLDTIERRYTNPPDETAPDTAPGPDSGVSGEEGPLVEGHEEPPPPESDAPGEGEPPGGGDGQPAPAFTLSGVDYTADQIAQAIQVRDYFAGLPPQYIQAIDALTTGQYHLVPNQPSPQPPAAGQPPSPAASPPQTPPDDPYSPYTGGEWGDQPDPRIAQLQAELDQIKSTLQSTLPPVIQQQQQDTYNARLNEITEASTAFQSQYGLNEDQMRALEANIVQAQILPALQNRYNSLKGGMSAALEQMFWSTPDLRDPYLQRVQAARDAESTAQESDTLRKQQLTALSASGGSAPRREPVPSTPEDRWAAVAAEIAASMNGSGTIQ